MSLRCLLEVIPLVLRRLTSQRKDACTTHLNVQSGRERKRREEKEKRRRRGRAREGGGFVCLLCAIPTGRATPTCPRPTLRHATPCHAMLEAGDLA